MTNKLPVAGKRYKEKETGKIFKLNVMFDDAIRSMVLDGDNYSQRFPTSITFWERFEELPEDKAETKPSIFNEIRNLYELKYNDLDPHIEDIVKLNELAIEETKNEIISAFDEIFPKKNGESNFCDKAETRPETQNLKLSFEVKEAMEEFSKALTTPILGDFDDIAKSWRDAYFLINKTGWNLLNALDKQFNKTSDLLPLRKRKSTKKSKNQWKQLWIT